MSFQGECGVEFGGGILIASWRFSRLRPTPGALYGKVKKGYAPFARSCVTCFVGDTAFRPLGGADVGRRGGSPGSVSGILMTSSIVTVHSRFNAKRAAEEGSYAADSVKLQFETDKIICLHIRKLEALGECLRLQAHRLQICNRYSSV